MMIPSTVYCITGANRGVGLAMVTTLSTDPSNVIFAGVRHIAHTHESLESLKKTALAKIIIIEIKSGFEEGNREAAKQVAESVGHVDVLIPNAGLLENFSSVLNTTLNDWEDHFRVNTFGPIILFQAFHPLLVKSPTKSPKFIVISSGAGSLAVATNGRPLAIYGASKAAINFVMMKIHTEHARDDMVAFPLHPGLVCTDMGKTASLSVDFGASHAVSTLEESGDAMIQLIKESTRETHGGRFWKADGSEVPW